MKKAALFGIALLLLTVLSVTCSDDSDDEPAEEPAEERPSEGSPLQELTPSPESLPDESPLTVEPDAYPAPPAAGDGYPASEAQPTYDPYPGGLAVILHPVGQQCQEATFPDLNSAIVALEENGIAVFAAEEIALVVCEACSCPTSEHFRVQISPEDLDTAIELGWFRG